MRQLKTWGYVFKNSLANSSYYSSILKTNISFSFKYLFFLTFLTLLLSTLKPAIEIFMYLPQLPKTVNNLKYHLSRSYPPALEVRIKNGELSTNVKEPYFINIPQEMSDKKDTNVHLVTIDTQAHIEDYPKYNTVVLLTKNAAVYPRSSEKNSTRSEVFYFSNLKNPLVINKQNYDRLYTKIEPFINMIPLFVTVLVIGGILLFPLFIVPFAFIWHLVYLLFLAAILLVLAKLMGKNFSYSQIYQLSLHGLTVPIIITLLLGLFNISFPLLYSLIFIVWMGIVIHDLHYTK